MMWVAGVVSLLKVVLWLTHLAVDVVTILSFFMLRSYEQGALMIISLLVLQIIINGWLIKVMARKFNKFGLFLLFLTSQSSLYLLSRGAWHGLRACCVQSQPDKIRRTLKAKFALVFEVRSSFEKVPVEGSEYSLGSCVLSQSEVVPTETPETPLTSEASNVICDVEHGTDITVKMMKTKFVQDTNKILLNLDAPPEIYGGEPNIYKYIVQKLQALFGDQKNLAYHIVTDSTNTKILHASCTDKHIGSLPDRILSENPQVICSDTHYVLNLHRVNGYEVYNITKRSFGEVTTFVNRDLTKLIWLHTWPLAVVKILSTMVILILKSGKKDLTTVYVCTVFSILIWLGMQRSLYHTNADVFLLAGLRLFFSVVRTILVCGTGLVLQLLLIPITYLSAKAMGVAGFLGYLAFMKSARNVELFNDAVDMYTFYSMHNPIVQVIESIIYCIWAVCMYYTCENSHISSSFAIMLITIIGQTIGLGWLWFMRSRQRQTLRDPVQVLTLIKQMEYARM